MAISFPLLSSSITFAQSIETLKVDSQPFGVSTRYIGAVEGNVNFNIKDLQDLGINTYRIYGGMARWEAQDDDGRYGWPSIAEIKANPNVINWDWWDTIMTNPPNGSMYWSSGDSNTVWQGNARTVFSQLKQAGIRPVVTVRTIGVSWKPDWALQLNPPRTVEDWNEWWEHVFATVYWMNVRNDYGVDEWELSNEPDNRDQGWGGNQADYFELVKVVKEAIDYVYKTYLPGRTYHIHAPKTVTGSSWPFVALQQIPDFFTSMNIHNYDLDISNYTRRVRQAMSKTALANAPLWLGEWGTFKGGYDDVAFSVNLIKNLMRGCLPETYVYGSHIFSLYDWGKQGGFKGLIGWDQKRTLSYYAMRMGIRALQGGKPTFSVPTRNPNLMAMATKDNRNSVYLLVANSGAEADTLNVDLSALKRVGVGTVWEFSGRVSDDVVGNVTLKQGIANLNLPATAAILVEFQDSK